MLTKYDLIGNALKDGQWISVRKPPVSLRLGAIFCALGQPDPSISRSVTGNLTSHLVTQALADWHKDPNSHKALAQALGCVKMLQIGDVEKITQAALVAIRRHLTAEADVIQGYCPQARATHETAMKGLISFSSALPFVQICDPEIPAAWEQNTYTVERLNNEFSVMAGG